jgi:hypothetical protein
MVVIVCFLFGLSGRAHRGLDGDRTGDGRAACTACGRNTVEDRQAQRICCARKAARRGNCLRVRLRDTSPRRSRTVDKTRRQVKAVWGDLSERNTTVSRQLLRHRCRHCLRIDNAAASWMRKGKRASGLPRPGRQLRDRRGVADMPGTASHRRQHRPTTTPSLPQNQRRRLRIQSCPIADHRCTQSALPARTGRSCLRRRKGMRDRSPSYPPPRRHRDDIGTGYDEVIEQPHVYQRQGLLQPHRHRAVSRARLGATGRVVVRHDHRRRVRR